MRTRGTALAVFAAAVLAGCGNGDEGAETRPRAALDAREPRTLVSGLEVPWELAFLPGGDLLVTERGGALRLVHDGQLVAEPVAELSAGGAGEGGLLGLALHPRYPDENFVFLYYTAGFENRVSRFRLVEGGPAGLRLQSEEVLVEGIPAASIHDGGRIAFGPDGQLYVATGDAGRPELAADRSSLAGKILRLAPDGSVPDGNPFGDSPVWSFGHRNVQGLAWDDDGRLYATEHGPSGDLNLCCRDELNLIEPGSYYGWPFRAGDGDTGLGIAPPAEPIDPIATSGADTTWAPSGAVVHRAEDGTVGVLVAQLTGRRLERFELSEDGREVVGTETVLDGLGRLRHVADDGRGCLYVLTSNRDGRGDPAPDDDRIVALCE